AFDGGPEFVVDEKVNRQFHSKLAVICSKSSGSKVAGQIDLPRPTWRLAQYRIDAFGGLDMLRSPMKRIVAGAFLAWAVCVRAADGEFEMIKRDVEGLKKRVAALEEENAKLKREATFERVVVKKELIVSDTGSPWEMGYEAHQIPRGIYARSLFDGPGGLWVRSRLIKGEIDD